MSEVDEELLRTTDQAGVWAAEFAKLHPEVDEGTMIAWFANCAETAKALARERMTDGSVKPIDEQRDQLDLVLRAVHEGYSEMESINDKLGRMASGLTLVACGHARDALAALDALRREIAWQLWDDDDG